MSYSLKAELHCHSNNLNIRNIYTPLINDSAQTVEEIVDRCIKQDIRILSITDHDSLSGYFAAQKYIEDNNIDILLIPGMEITTKQGHVLAYNITEEIPPKLSAQKTIDLIHQQKGIAIVAHPFMIKSTGNKLFNLKPDAIEGLNAAIPMFANNKAISAANKMQLPYTSSSDAHNISAVGDGCTVFPSNTKTVEDFISCIKTGNFSIKFKHSSYWKMFTEHLIKLIEDIFSGRIFQPIPQEALAILEKERD